MKLPAILVNYCFDPMWLEKYPDIEPVIYDRSDDGVERDLTKYGKVFNTKNLGDVDFDKLSWLVENYDKLPDVFLWSKTNLFRFIGEEEFNKVRHNRTFTPLNTLSHRIYSDFLGPVNKYMSGISGEIYAERTNVTNGLFNTRLDQSGRVHSWQDWALHFGLPIEEFIPFAPGGSYILTREAVHKHSKDLYEDMLSVLPYAMHPIEAHLAERSYYYLFR